MGGRLSCGGITCGEDRGRQLFCGPDSDKRLTSVLLSRHERITIRRNNEFGCPPSPGPGRSGPHRPSDGPPPTRRTPCRSVARGRARGSGPGRRRRSAGSRLGRCHRVRHPGGLAELAADRLSSVQCSVSRSGALATVQGILPQPNHVVSPAGVILPGSAHPGPYTSELAAGLAALGIPDRTVCPTAP